MSDAPVAERTPSWHARQSPDVPAVIMAASGEVTTYAQLEDRSSRMAKALRTRGLDAEDHIAVLMENNRQYLEVLWAAQRSELHYTAVNSHLRAEEIQYVLDDCGATALFTSEAMAEVLAGLDLSGVAVRICAVGELDGFERYDDVLAGETDGARPDEREGREMLYSSGTTGRPKGVRKPVPGTPFGDPTSAPVQVAEHMAMMGGAPGAVYLSPAPLYHAAPLVYCMSMLRLGATVVVMERFDPALCLDLIERHRVTLAQFVPTMFIRMLRLPEEQRLGPDTSSLQIVLHAAAPCPVAVKRQMIEWWGPILIEYYAGTEDVGSTIISSQEWLEHPGSVGRPVEECHIVGEEGEDQPPGEPGVVYFAGGRPFKYHNDPEKTASISNDKGWRTLGDVGYLDEDGYLFLTDRASNMIISGGVNVYPQEAENVLAGNPAVTDVAVIGVPDPEMGEAVKAVVQATDPSAGGPELEAELLAFCRSELASYKCPRSVDFVDDLPATTTASSTSASCGIATGRATTRGSSDRVPGTGSGVLHALVAQRVELLGGDVRRRQAPEIGRPGGRGVGGDILTIGTEVVDPPGVGRLDVGHVGAHGQLRVALRSVDHPVHDRGPIQVEVHDMGTGRLAVISSVSFMLVPIAPTSTSP